jgi:translation initiation factor IF-2
LATRIFELARDLGVTSKMVLTKCRAEGLEVKNHMSTVSAGLEATVREWFTEESRSPHTAVETAAHVDLDRARAQARKSRRKKPRAEKAEEAPVEEAPAEELAELPAAGTAIAEAPAEVKPQAAAVAGPPTVSEAAEPAAAAAVAEAPVAAEAATVEAPAEPTAPPEEGPPPGEAEEEAAEPEGPLPEPEQEPVLPAGPQVVPKPAKLQGPRIVRVEAPDFIDHPPRRRQAPVPTQFGPTPITGGSGRAPEKAAPDEAAPHRKKGKRRSPRRRSTTGRSADSGAGERLKEWRERDLQERSARLAAAAGGGLRRHRASVSRKDLGLGGPAVKAGRVEIDEPITVKSLSAATGLKSAVIIRKLMEMGTLATLNQTVGVELAEAIVGDFDIELVVRRAKTAEEELVERLGAREVGRKQPRAPVVTFLGHVDHGKTSLLDRIRHTTVAPGEAGGITQHIGAYRYDMEDKHVVFLDTPGHEAFTAMRARGANMTDVVVLVVAADDGVMPQTVEAISHARAAKVPIVVALNKMDVPNANVQRAMGQLAENNLQPREWGGDIEVIQTSAETGQGIGELVEILSLEAELLELTAEPHAPATGYVIEAEMDPGRGALARLLIRNGTLKVGDILLAGRGYGRIRQIMDDKGNEIDQAGPSTPVEVAGLDEAPAAGDRFYIVHDIDDARQVAEDRRQRARAEQLGTGTRVTLEGLLSRIEAGEASEVPLIVKADVQGSIEALTGSLEKLSTDEIRVNILHAAVGGISTGDVTLAEASGAIIIGFNVVPDAAARQLAERTGVDIRAYRVIYDIVDDMRSVLEGGLAPEIREETLGRAEVRQVFKVSRVGSIAGCYVTDGLVSRSCLVRITRDNIVVEDERSLDSLRRFKDDAREVRAGLECGLKISGYDDIKEGDILEFYQKVEVARKL